MQKQSDYPESFKDGKIHKIKLAGNNSTCGQEEVCVDPASPVGPQFMQDNCEACCDMFEQVGFQVTSENYNEN